MKSKQSFSKNGDKRSAYTEFDSRLKPVKPKTGKSGKRISIYDKLDDDFDESELDVVNYKSLDADDEPDFYTDDDEEE